MSQPILTLPKCSTLPYFILDQLNLLLKQAILENTIFIPQYFIACGDGDSACEYTDSGRTNSISGVGGVLLSGDAWLFMSHTEWLS